jgi:hypothetical protein
MNSVSRRQYLKDSNDRRNGPQLLRRESNAGGDRCNQSCGGSCRADQSALMFAALMTGHHFSISAAW